MATSPNYNWPEPDNTDLVKNGALAIRTAVNAIDTSLAELKGGTTGQVLSKTSNTDMDFTWVAQDDSNAIQNAIVDAKGDLIAASAADTPARLAAGTNGQVLTVDSTASAGLAYTNKGWTLISQTTLSGASVTISSIPQSYRSLKLLVVGATNSTADGRFSILPNNAATAYVSQLENASGYAILGAAWQTQQTIGRTNQDNTFTVNFDDYAQAINLDHNFAGSYFYVKGDGTNIAGMFGGMVYTAAITGMVLYNTGGNFAGGTAYLYGVA